MTASAPPSAGAYRLAVLVESSVLGGAERAATYLLDALPDGAAVTVVGTDREVVASVVAARPSAAGEVCDGSVRGWVRALRRAAPDVVHANLTSFTNCRRGVLAALVLRMPVVLVDHLPTPGLSARGRWAQRATTRLAAARVAVSAGAARDVERFAGLRPGSVVSIDNGVPPRDDVDPAGLRDGGDGRAPVLGFLGRLEPVKGVDVLLRALAEVPRCRLRVAGTGSQRAALERLAAEVGVADRVELCGRVESAAFLAGVDVLVLPSYAEAMPLTLLEAMHAGVPVVATDVGAARAMLLDGEAGALVEPGDAAGLARVLRDLVSDPRRRRALASRGLATARGRFSAGRMAREYDALYRRVAGRR